MSATDATSPDVWQICNVEFYDKIYGCYEYYIILKCAGHLCTISYSHNSCDRELYSLRPLNDDDDDDYYKIYHYQTKSLQKIEKYMQEYNFPSIKQYEFSDKFKYHDFGNNANNKQLDAVTTEVRAIMEELTGTVGDLRQFKNAASAEEED